MAQEDPFVVVPLSVSHLTDLLVSEEGINLDLWGRDGTRTVADLYEEIVVTRECELVRLNGKLFRRLKVVKMRIFEPSRGHLMEVRLIKKDGTVRTRKVRPPGGKPRGDETLEQALIRETKEELRLIYEFGDYTYRCAETVVEEESSSSFPGLPSRYEMTYFDLTLSEQSLQRVAPEGHACLDPETGTIIQCAWVKE